MKKILTIFLLTFGFQIYSQVKNISGTVKDETGEPLIGVTVLVKDIAKGVVTNFDGNYTLKIKEDKVLVFSYVGYKTVEISTTGKLVVDVIMKTNFEALSEVVLTGIRSSQLAAIKAKRDDALVIEAITPEDIGNFSDSNVADALQRIAGVQIERNVDDGAGDRVSIRGIGPQFVSVTMNGRSPISAGNEGKSDFRKFNLNVIPSEIISGARIKKTTQAKEVTTNIGGTVDFLTIKPLEMKYKRGKNYLGSVNVRNEQNVEFNELDPTDFSGRFSGVYTTKINEKLGVAISAIYANENRLKDESSYRGLNFRNFNVDTSGNDSFDEGEDTVFGNILAPNTINNTLVRTNEVRLTGSAAIQWRPIKELDFLLDYTRTNVDSNSSRQSLSMSGFTAGGASAVYGDDNFFNAEDIIIEDGNLLYMSPSNTNTRTRIDNKAQDFNNYTTNNILGLRTTLTPSEKLSVIIDASYSDLDFKQSLTQVTGRFDDYDQTELSVDTRGGVPSYELPLGVFNPQSYNLNQVSNRAIYTKGYNYATTIDIAYDLSEATTVTFGGRHANTNFEARETLSSRTINFEQYGAITDEDTAEFQNLLTHTAGVGFNGGDIDGLENGWLYIPNDAVYDMFPGFVDLDGGSVFDFDVALKDVVSDDDNLQFNPLKSYGAEETSTDFYTQLDWKTAIFQIPVALNFGVRAVRTENRSEGFSAVDNINFLMPEDNSTIDSNFAAVHHEVESSRWDVLPSFNANFTLKKNLKLRLNVSKGVSRPRYRDLIPNNEITFVNNVPDGTDLGSQNLVFGEVKSGNPELKPYTAWMYDATVEGYTKGGGAFVFSAFYKGLRDYIGRSTVTQEYPGEELLGVALPADNQGLLFDVSKPINIGDAQLYGFEIGITQHLKFLPGFLKGFGIKANYAFVESSFDIKESLGDGVNDNPVDGFPGSSKHSANGTFYYEQKSFSLRFTAAYRGDYLSNLGGIGSTRADQGHFTEGTTVLGFTGRYNMLKRKLQLSLGVNNLTSEGVRRYQGGDKKSFSAYYHRDPIWKLGLRYKF